MVEGRRLLASVPELSLPRKRVLQMLSRAREVTEPLVAVADEPEGDRFSQAVPALPVAFQRLLEKGKSFRRPFFRINLPRSLQ